MSWIQLLGWEILALCWAGSGWDWKYGQLMGSLWLKWVEIHDVVSTSCIIMFRSTQGISMRYHHILLKKVSRVLDWADHESGSPKLSALLHRLFQRGPSPSCHCEWLDYPGFTPGALWRSFARDLGNRFSQVLENLVIWMKLGPDASWWPRVWSIWS